MDYEKKYKEALERARQIQNTPYTAHWDVMKEVVEDIFPELKESEDEKIRKELIQFFSDKDEEDYEGLHPRAQIVAWLENQGQVKESIISQHENKICKESDDSLTSENERIRKAMIDFFKHEREEGVTVLHYGANIECMIAWLEKQGEQPKNNDVCNNCDQQGSCVSPCPMKLVEKQGEQKLAEWTAEDEEELKIALNTLEEAGQYSSAKWLKNVCLVPQTIQNPAWSEEDKNVVNLILSIVSDFKNSFSGHVGAAVEDDIKKIDKWLKSLKDRVRPKQEWSEEDKNMLQYAIEHFERQKRNYTEGGNGKKAMQEFIDWLKSLKNRYAWKPSEEQIEAVRIAAEIGTANNSWAMGILESMYQQLKKLREE